jgi:prepilin-type N-terminal cleavage/methylation domain-containing protein
MKHRSLTRQSGFTLVEIAIVLVIIGLLLGGVLKGQEMITSAKAKNLINDLKSVSTAFYAYQDKYKAIPGDDAAASTRFTGADNGNGNGTITGLFTANGAPGGGNESNTFWQHTRMAGLMSGAATDAVALPPQNAVGGLLGVQSEVSAAGGSTYGMTGPVVCAGSVPWKTALAVDIALDDGSSATGDLRAGIAGAANQATALAPATNVAGGAATGYGPLTPATAGLEAGIHTICMRIRT